MSSGTWETCELRADEQLMTTAQRKYLSRLFKTVLVCPDDRYKRGMVKPGIEPSAGRYRVWMAGISTLPSPVGVFVFRGGFQRHGISESVFFNLPGPEYARVS